MTTANPGEKKPDPTALREAVVRRLLALEAKDELPHWKMRAVAEAHDVHWRTVRRWMDNARAHHGTYTPAGRPRFTLTPRMHEVLAMWCGNATAAYRDLQAHPHPDDPPLPSLATFQRAVAREISPGKRAGLRGGEKARRRFDIHGQRPRGHRNKAWETDHVEASVWVNVEGTARKPWITWFIDCAHNTICGLAITPHTPSRQAILTAMRDALLRGGEHSPFGGTPERVRVDRGKDFLSTVVDKAFSAIGTTVHALPARHPEWKGSIEALNGAVKKMLFTGMPGYSEEPIPKGGKPPTDIGDLLHFHAFVAALLDWVTWWNTEHTIRDLGNRTPAQSWQNDLTPIEDINPKALHSYTLERHGTPLTINAQGVRWKKGWYIADWMHGHVGKKVELRYMPHHYRTVELYDPATGHHRGQALLSNEATRQQKRALKRAWHREAEDLTTLLKKANRRRIDRYAATSRPADPEPSDTLTSQEADQQLRELTARQEDREPYDDTPPLLPLPDPTPSWDTLTPSPPQPAHDLGLDDPESPPEGFSLPAPTSSWDTTPPPPESTDEEQQP